ncbi:YibE/F family protein [Candidatus Peregrinibacteria bacterium]|nr:MAG: YibE/F family protein [Candidatus Peregrinibacteria bacterium]
MEGTHIHQLSFKRFLLFLLLFLGLLFGINIPTPEPVEDHQSLIPGIVTAEESTQEDSSETPTLHQILTVEVKPGTPERQSLSIENSDIAGPDARLFYEGDKVYVAQSEIPGEAPLYSIADHDRRTSLYLLFGIFCLTVLLISGKQGVESFFGMIFSFAVLLKLILPLLMLGMNPVLSALAGAALIIPSTFYLSHGFQKKTHIAVLGTLLTLALTGLISQIFIPLSHLSGLADESAFYLKIGSEVGFNFQGLLLAGVLISMLGILDDITVSQASIAEELQAAKPKISFTELYSRCMTVGRDHIASMVNTLILVYAGSSLPLMLLFLSSDHSFNEVINMELVAQEIVHTLVGSIGLICAVPITTLLACIKIKKR